MARHALQAPARALPPALQLATLLLLALGRAAAVGPRSSRVTATEALQATLASLPRQPRIAIVNTMPFHLEIVAGLVDATLPFRNSTTIFLNPAVWPGAERSLGFLPWIQDVKCESMQLQAVPGTAQHKCIASHGCTRVFSAADSPSPIHLFKLVRTLCTMSQVGCVSCHWTSSSSLQVRALLHRLPHNSSSPPLSRHSSSKDASCP